MYFKDIPFASSSEKRSWQAPKLSSEIRIVESMGLKHVMLAITPLRSPVHVPLSCPGTNESWENNRTDYIMDSFNEEYDKSKAGIDDFDRCRKEAAQSLVEVLSKTKRKPPINVFEDLVPNLLKKLSSDSEGEKQSGSLVKVVNPGGAAGTKQSFNFLRLGFDVFFDLLPPEGTLLGLVGFTAILKSTQALSTKSAFTPWPDMKDFTSSMPNGIS